MKTSKHIHYDIKYNTYSIWFTVPLLRYYGFKEIGELQAVSQKLSVLGAECKIPKIPGGSINSCAQPAVRSLLAEVN
jgi:hypothetical protein